MDAFTFVPINSWRAIDRAGRQVEILGRVGISVIEGDCEYFVGSELAGSPDRISLFADEAFRITIDGRVHLDPQERVRVCRIAYAGLVALGMQIDVLPLASVG